MPLCCGLKHWICRVTRKYLLRGCKERNTAWAGQVPGDWGAAGLRTNSAGMWPEFRWRSMAAPWTDIASCNYAERYSFDSQGFPVALCICSLKAVWLPVLQNWFSKEGDPFQLPHVDFPTAPKYIYLWVANRHWRSFFAFCTFEIFFLYIVFAARPVELIHWI